MAIAPTGNMFKAFSFDNVSSRTYGVYITGEAVYNAPERDTEMISILGRNGAFALDRGRFENIEVTYPAGIYADSETDFAEAISNFRNFLCSRRGYVRLQDEYNPSEYRMAVYKSGLEVTPAELKAGEFNITFECQPQRFLTSGENKITATDGETFTNPTLFDASPLLEAKGYGTIGFNDYEINIENSDFGDVTLFEKGTYYKTNEVSVVVPKKWYYATDTITVVAKVPWGIFPFVSAATIRTATVSDSDSNSSTVLTKAYPSPSAERGRRLYETRSNLSFTAGTYETKTDTITATITTMQDATVTLHPAWSVKYENVSSSEDKFTFKFTSDGTENPTMFAADDTAKRPMSIDKISVDSTKTAHGDPTYIDCDLGVAYRDFYGETISLNKYIDLGSKLPKLASGENIVSFDNTISELKITPRWWKI